MDDLGGFVIQLIFDTGLYNKVKFKPDTGKGKNAEPTTPKKQGR